MKQVSQSAFVFFQTLLIFILLSPEVHGAVADQFRILRSALQKIDPSPQTSRAVPPSKVPPSTSVSGPACPAPSADQLLAKLEVQSEQVLRLYDFALSGLKQMGEPTAALEKEHSNYLSLHIEQVKKIAANTGNTAALAADDPDKAAGIDLNQCTVENKKCKDNGDKVHIVCVDDKTLLVNLLDSLAACDSAACKLSLRDRFCQACGVTAKEEDQSIATFCKIEPKNLDQLIYKCASVHELRHLKNNMSACPNCEAERLSYEDEKSCFQDFADKCTPEFHKKSDKSMQQACENAHVRKGLIGLQIGMLECMCKNRIPGKPNNYKFDSCKTCLTEAKEKLPGLIDDTLKKAYESYGRGDKYVQYRNLMYQSITKDLVNFDSHYCRGNDF